MYHFGIILVFLIDRLSKEIITKTMFLNQSLPVIKNIFHLTYIKNYGALWGIMPGARIFFITAGLFILLVITLYERTLNKSEKIYKFALGLIAGGVLGNLYDRIFYKAVIDFIDFRFWPVFNFADTFTNVGIFIIIFLTLSEKKAKNAPDSF